MSTLLTYAPYAAAALLALLAYLRLTAKATANTVDDKIEAALEKAEGALEAEAGKLPKS